jgi:N-acetylglutamate synthase-like GNAT family acetyltransferase
MLYRKANIDDLDSIVNLVTNLLGTCNIDDNKSTKDKSDIINKNRNEIKKDIDKYYVCEIDKKIIGACGISDIKNKNKYDLDL